VDILYDAKAGVHVIAAVRRGDITKRL
jgi:hypothetical protein